MITMFRTSAGSLRLIHLPLRSCSIRIPWMNDSFCVKFGYHWKPWASSCAGFHRTPIASVLTKVNMPSLSPTMMEGTIVKWLKQEGDTIAPGDVLCEIQTDKAVVSLEYDEEGILAKVLKPENSSDIKVGVPIALVVDEGDDWKNVETPKDLDTHASSADAVDAVPSQPKSPSPPAVMSVHTRNSLIGPAVRNLLLQYGLKASQIPASGSHGNLLKGDILNEITEKHIQPVPACSIEKPLEFKPSKGKTSAPEAPTPSVDIEATNMRRTIAKRLLQSKSTIPHGYATANCRITAITSFRKRMQTAGLKTSVNDFIIKSTANALGKVPGINVVWEGAELKQLGKIDISVAVATESGLVTPIITDSAEKDILQISEDVGHLAAKARSGKLQPHEFMGGSFTISNLGMFGIHHFTAIINPPQCAILAVGGGHTYIGENGDLENEISVSLSYDASGISEETALKFLAHLKHELENCSETTMGIYNIDSRLEVAEMSQIPSL